LFSLSITVALYGGTKFSSIRDDAVVVTHFSQNTSFTQIGTPARVELISFSTKLELTKLKASSVGSSFLILS